MPSAPSPVCGYSEGDDDDAPLQLSPGTILYGTYLVGRVLGQGGFGITYLEYFPQQYATRLSGESRVSAFSGSLSNQYAYGLDKFLQEARILAQFEGHPNIVAVRNYFQANGTAYLVMSYVEGVTLKEYLKIAGGTISFDQVITLINPVLDALKEVHRVGILHRDISPDNIFINKKGQVVLHDFGAAPMYYLVTAIQPPDALERLVDDTLMPPAQMGVVITAFQKQALLKALAVRTTERFQTVEAFQASLMKEKRPLVMINLPSFTSKCLLEFTASKHRRQLCRKFINKLSHRHRLPFLPPRVRNHYPGFYLTPQH